MGCDITKNQNQHEQLIELAAMRQLYAEAKRWNAAQFCLSVLPAFAWAVALIFKPELKVYATVSALIFTLNEVFFLEARQKALLKTAARIQERFDCTTLCLDWNGVKAGTPADPEDVNAAATRYRKRTGDVHYRELTNWYRTSLDQLPVHQARLLAQRSSMRWDMDLRRKYKAGIIGITVGVGVLLVIAGLIAGMSLQNFFLIVLAPWAPAMVWGVKEAKKQDTTIKRAEELKAHIERLWREALNPNAIPEQLARDARSIQDEIFLYRSTCPPIAEWLYARRKTAQEDDMHAAVDAMVKDALQRS